MPFGISTFSSFGADRTRVGYGFGLYGGHRFSRVLSLEAQASWGKTAMSARACCVNSGYWLGTDGNRYLAPVAGMDGHYYADLKSDVKLQSYGLQLNVNVLGFFNKTKHSRWALDISPRIAAVSTKAKIKTTDNATGIKTDDTRWHFGAGANVTASYAVTRNLSIGLYSGITALTGKAIDGIPRRWHSSNFIWESGVRIGWTFGNGSKHKGKETMPAPPDMAGWMEKEGLPVPAWRNDTIGEPSVAIAEVQVSADMLTDTAMTFPTIYFPFNMTSVRESELPKVEQIAGILLDNQEIRITITGWCDTTGSRAVNDRISRLRAEAVKRLLVAHGIAADRIKTIGRGIDYKSATPRKARRVEATEGGKEERR